MNLEEVLNYAFQQNYHLDHSNAAIHCGKVRYSPLTFRLAEQISRFANAHNQDITEEVATVMRDKGAYEEDKGR